MLHPVIATELVRQRQATLDAEARHQRLVRQALSRVVQILTAADSSSRHGRLCATSALR
jgi:hypothetical protein